MSRRRRRGLSAVAAAALSMMMLTGCPNLDPIVNTGNAAVVAIDNAIAQISAASGSWQTVLQDTVAKLTADAQSTVRVEVQTLLNNSIAAVQVGAMCTVDFVGHRVVDALEAIKAKILGQTPPPPSPTVCSSSPPAVEFAAWQQNRVPIVTLTGFDLRGAMTVELVQTTGTQTVPGVLAQVSQYQATINLGATGLRLTPQAKRIVVSTGGTPAMELSAINVIQPQPKICQERDVMVTPGPIGLPANRHTRGDKEFNGNGPRISARLDLAPVGSRLNYTVSMTATETKSDFTTFTGSAGGTLALAPPIPSGFRIEAINGSSASTASYTDQDHTNDQVSPTNGGPVRQFVFVGDTDGDDFGRTRLVSATFNPIGLHIVESEDCVSQLQARRMLTIDKDLTPDLRKRLEDALRGR